LHNQAPLQTRAQTAPEFMMQSIIVLDTEQRIFASSDPRRYTVHSKLADHGPEYSLITQALQQEPRKEPWFIQPKLAGRIHLITPIVSDDTALGMLLMSYPENLFLPYQQDLINRALWVTLLGLAILLPLAAWWATRIAKPLVELADAMAQAGEKLPPVHALPNYAARDEVGQLWSAFQSMLRGLHEKARLERELVLTGRMAAIGRLSAGIAHEINNPLGGLLNAVNTFKRHGSNDALSQKTIALIERGLLQIRDTVAALLVEAKPEQHALTPEDIEDTRTLVMTAIEAQQAQLDWQNRIEHPLPLPATHVRQVLINLLLNACEAIRPHGRISCLCMVESEMLCIKVRNDGQHIPEQELPYLFEPYAEDQARRTGLGLWVCYQIVSQLEGRIRVRSVPEDTEFIVEIPIPRSAEAAP
jgi:Signal transduction histidine kinase